jgi:hypothetical protein
MKVRPYTSYICERQVETEKLDVSVAAILKEFGYGW